MGKVAGLENDRAAGNRAVKIVSNDHVQVVGCAYADCDGIKILREVDFFARGKVSLDSFALNHKAVGRRPEVFDIIPLRGEIAPAAAKRN